MKTHAITTVGGSPLTMHEMKRSLRVTSHDLDTEVRAAFRNAREWCERQVNRTFATTVTRRVSLSEWPAAPFYFDWPPFVAILSVLYQDDDDAQQTLATTEYGSVVSTTGPGHMYWTYNATLPTLYARPDAVQINYTSGYASRDDIPDQAKEAIKVVAEGTYHHRDDPTMMQRHYEAATHILYSLDWGAYR